MNRFPSWTHDNRILRNQETAAAVLHTKPGRFKEEEWRQRSPREAMRAGAAGGSVSSARASARAKTGVYGRRQRHAVNVALGVQLLPASLGLPGVSSAFSVSAVPLGVALLFALATAALDAAGLRELGVAAGAAGLVAFQLSTLAVGAAFAVPEGVGIEYAPLLGILRFVLGGQLLALLGAWAALNHGVLREKYPRSTALLERASLLIAPFIASAHVAILAVALLGAEAAPFGLAAACAVHRALYSSSSSFSSVATRVGSDVRRTLGEGYTRIVCSFLLVQPALLHVCVFVHGLWRDWTMHAATLALLIGAPLALDSIAAVMTPAKMAKIKKDDDDNCDYDADDSDDEMHGLGQRGRRDAGFADDNDNGGNDGNVLTRMLLQSSTTLTTTRTAKTWARIARRIAPVLLVTLGIEVRLVFTAFAPYIKLAPPMSYILVTVSMVFGTMGAMGFFIDELMDSVGLTLLGICLSLSACSGALALGMPVLFTPAPLAAVGGLMLYAESLSIVEYALFVAGCVVTLGWFLWEHFWSLDVIMGEMSLRGICILATLAATLAAAVPGCIACGVQPRVSGTLLVVQALAIVILEKNLADAEDDGLAVYPPYAVLATSVAGLCAAAGFRAADYIGGAMRWFLGAVYAGKLSLILVPGGRNLASTLLLLTVAGVPVLMPASSTAASLTSSSPSITGKERGVGHKTARGHGAHSDTGAWALVAVCALALVNARSGIFDALAAASGYRPPDAALVGLLLIVLGAAMMSVLAKHFSSSVVPTRVGVIIAVIGAIIACLQPPLPPSLVEGACMQIFEQRRCIRLWDMDPGLLVAHVSRSSASIASSGGFDILPSGDAYATWFLVAAGALGTALLVAQSRRRRTVAVSTRIGLAVACGASFGAYVSFGVVKTSPVLQVLVTLATVLVCVAMAFLTARTAHTPSWLLWPILGFFALIPPSFAMAIAVASTVVAQSTSSSALGTNVVAELTLHEQVSTVSSVFMLYSMLIAFGIKLRVGKTVSTSLENAGMGSSSSSSSSSVRTHSDAMFGGRLSLVGNLAAVLAAILAVVTPVWNNAGGTQFVGDMRIICTSAILLLYNMEAHSNALNRRGIRQPQQSNNSSNIILHFRPYLPTYVFMITVLMVSTAVQIRAGPVNSEIVESTWRDDIWRVKNLLLLCMALASHVLFVLYVTGSSMTEHARGENLLLPVTAMGIPVIFLCGAPTARTLVVLGMIIGAVHYYSLRSRRIERQVRL